MNDNQLKFQNLLRELFQFDCADIDFGIYRIMNHKRAIIEKFISEDLPQGIREELEKGALAEQEQAMQALQKARKKILEALGDNALDGNGQLSEAYRNTNAGKDYLAAQQQAAKSKSREALESAIYNHLYTFFSRYWQEGDFISKRRYSKKERYAIPYNGEEVYLYWANQDQYYVKTGEYFTDYTYKGPKGITVDFKLQQANVEQNNIKGEKRFFLPRPDEIVWDEAARQLLIPFEYRPLNAQEAITYSQKNQQEAIIAKAVMEIPKRVKAPDALIALTAERKATSGGTSTSYLEYHLRQYTRRNSSDFFIHKDLKGFFSRELDFYLKNEVLNLEELEAAGEDLAKAWFQLLRLIKRIGLRIIEFLAQIEDFQKMLWEKRKFITESFYLITISNIPEIFYKEIAECKAQWDEWQSIFAIDGLSKDLLSSDMTTLEGRIAYMKESPTLVLDTRHFPPDFTDRLLASFENLDEMADGLLVHSENWQALNLLQEKYREQVKCIHIDPPYNTQTSGFLYKNDYQHSSWLAMMENRVCISQTLLSHDGHFLSHIDENEYERLKILFDTMGIPDAGTVIWDKRNPMTARQGVATQHEYIAWRSTINDSIYQNNTNIVEMLRTAKAIIAKHGGVTEDARHQYAEWVRKNLKLSGGEKAYCYLDEQGRIYSSVSLRAPEPRADPKFFQPLMHPVTNKPCAIPPNGFSRTPETLKAMVERGEILFGPDETTQPRQKRFLTEESQMQVRSVIQDAKKGKDYLDVMGLDFPYCHPVSLYQELIAAAIPNSGIVLDFFAGSGTTGHAVINLNREDGGRRKFILVEMAGYFDTVLLPRIKKVTFTPEWKDGKPKRTATPEEAQRSPRIIKVIRLESYEDALNNLTFDEQGGKQALELFKDDYLLSYMLKWETRHSETLLNVEQLQSPFSYTLHLYRDGEIRESTVNLPETLNYLLGLDVQTRRIYNNDEQSYLIYRGTLRNGRIVVIIWRDITGWKIEDYEREATFVAEQNLTAGADEIYVNGDSRIPGARSLDQIFKERMFAAVEA